MSSIPQKYDHELIIGDTYFGQGRVVGEDKKTPVDLTGASGVCTIESSAGVTLLSPTVTIVDAANGVFSWSSDPEDTAGLNAGQTACFYLVLTYADTTVKTVLEGKVKIRERCK